MCNVVFMISGKHFRIAFSIHSPSLENCTDTRVTVAATSHACSPYAEICVIILQPNSILCFSSQHILRGEGLSGWYKQPIVFFSPVDLLTQRVSFVWHSFVWRERGRESPMMSAGACSSNSIHKDLSTTQSCQKLKRVLIYPHRSPTCRLLIKLICCFKDTQEGRELRFLCPAIGLSWRGSTAGAASLTSEKKPIF